MRQTILVVTVSLVLTASLLNAQTTGHISGTVVNEDGAVVNHMEVCSAVTSGSSRTINCTIPVDNEGHFQIENVKFGSFDIFAINAEEDTRLRTNLPA